MRRIDSLHLPSEKIILLYAAAYFLITLGIHLAFFPIGDIGVESDFYGELVVAAKELVRHNFSVSNYPYKGPFYSFALVSIHLFCRDWYLSGVLLNALCAAASLIVIFRLLSNVFDRKIALLATFAVSLGYEFFTLSHKASSDMLFLFLCYCSISVLLMERFSRRRLIVGGILSAFAFLTRYTGICLPVALIAVLLINPGRWSRRRCRVAAVMYLAIFFAVCAPWFIKNINETGSLLATRNIENVVREFYGDRKAGDIPEGGFKSILQVFTHNPAYFVKHYLLSIAKHFWTDMTTFLALEGILVMLGIVRLFFRPPTRKQWAFLAFPICYFLVICNVFPLSRFSLPLSPAYFAILFSMLLAMGEISRFPLIGKPKQTGKQKSETAQKKRKKSSSGDPPAMTVASGFRAIKITTALIIVALFCYQIMVIVKAESYYYGQRPVFILEAAQFLKEHAAQEHRAERAIVLARKPHIAYYSGLIYKQYPPSLANLREFIVFARNQNVDYIVYSDIERSYYEDAAGRQPLDTIEGIKRIYSLSSITIYELNRRN